MSLPEGDPKDVAVVGAASEEPLPFTVALWDRSREIPERIIGRAATMVLAQAIFQAAQADFAGERITLSRGARVLMDTH